MGCWFRVQEQGSMRARPSRGRSPVRRMSAWQAATFRLCSIELGSLDCGPAEGVGAKVLSARAAEMRCVSTSVRGEHTFIMLGA